MREVAALAGVSLKTVSRVVNREGSVSPEATSRVQRAVQQLGYRHNLAASNLRRSHGRTAMVGALLQDVSNSFSASLLRSLEDAARERDMVIVAASLDEEPERERELVESLVRRRVDGLLLMPATTRQDYLADDLRSGLPVVFVDRRPNGVDADSVTVDNELGSRMAADHLLAQGHRRIAMLADLEGIQTAAARRRGFEQGLAGAGVTMDPMVVDMATRSPDDALAAVHRIFASPEPPTAIFAARNTLAIGAIRALHQLGLAGQVALVGFDDFPLADIVNPPLTVIRQNVRAMGLEVTRRLFARIDGDDSVPQHVVLRPELVQRGSGEIRPE
jgi:LacI family transcriptional regulator